MTPRIGSWDYVDYASRGDNNASAIMGAAGYVHDKTKILDPLYWLLGKKKYGKIQKFLGDTGPTWTNEQLAPITRAVGKTDLLRQAFPKGSGVDTAGKWTENKSGDAIAAVLASVYGIGALGAMGGGGAGGAGGGAGGGSSGAAGPGSWQFWAQNGPGMIPQQQAPQQVRRPPPGLLQQRRQQTMGALPSRPGLLYGGF